MMTVGVCVHEWLGGKDTKPFGSVFNSLLYFLFLGLGSNELTEVVSGARKVC